MIKFEKPEVFNFAGAFRGLRNPKDSWAKSDSFEIGITRDFKLGPNDLDLAQRMIGAGTDESKFLRQIGVSVDITAPLYWWKEFDTYKVGTVSNSCSTMHKIDAYPITKESFCFDEAQMLLSLNDDLTYGDFVNATIASCEKLRQKFKETGDKKYWRALIQILPEAWMQKRTITLNYQVLRAMYFTRRHHKLTEWHELCDWIEKLPYGKELICYEKQNKLGFT